MEETKDKYKLFRNFMVNELGISRADIEQWTKEAIAEQAQKMTSQINVHGIVKAKADSIVHQIREGVVHEVATQLAGRIRIDVGV